MPSQKQKAILEYLVDGSKTKAQIVNRFKTWQYRNQNKHIGEILSRMVKQGLIIRIEKGIYARKTAPEIITKEEGQQGRLF